MVARVRVVRPMPTVCVGPAGAGPRSAVPGSPRHLANSSVRLGDVDARAVRGLSSGAGWTICLVSGRLVGIGGVWCAGGGLLAWLGESGWCVELNGCLPLDRDQGGDAGEAVQRC